MNWKKHKVLLGAIILVFLILLAGFLIIRSIKVSGFIHALQNLVEKETHGQYELLVGSGHMDFGTLTFVLEDIELRKVDTVQQGGVQAVKVPRLFADLGSLKSFFSVGQIKIQSIEIENPYVKVWGKERQGTSRINVTDQFVGLFPPIETILKSFNVEKLSITRGELDIDKKQENFLEIGLIDFFILNWNMRNLTEESRVGLTVEGQKIKMGKTELQFSSVEYRYPEHYLQFNNIESETIDSLHDGRLKCKSVLISGLDYQELYDNGKYRLNKIVIESPEFVNNSNLGEKSANRHDIKSIFPALTNIFNDMKLDSTIIKNGSLELNIKRPNSSTSIRAPHFNFTLYGIRLSKDSSTSLIRDAHIEAIGAKINLNNEMNLSFDTLIMDGSDQFKATNLVINEAISGSSIEMPSLIIGQIDFANYVENDLIKAGSIGIERPVLKVGTIKNLKKRKSPPGNSRKIQIDIGSANIIDGSVNFKRPDFSTDVRGLNISIGALKSTSFDDVIRSIQDLTIAEVSLLQKDASFYGNQLDVDRTSVSIGSLKLRQNDLRITANDLLMRYPDLMKFDSKNIVLEHLDLKSLQIAGNYFHEPSDKSKGEDKRNETRSVRIIELKIDELIVDVTGKQSASLQGEKLSMVDLQLGKSNNLASIVGNFDNINYRDSTQSIVITSLKLNSQKNSVLNEIMIKRGKAAYGLRSMHLGVTEFGEEYKIAGGKLIGMEALADTTLNATVDSLLFSKMILNKSQKPSFESIEVYHPEMMIRTASRPKETGAKNSDNKPALNTDLVQRLAIYNAKVAVNDKVATMGNFVAQLRQNANTLSVSDVKFNSPNTRLQLQKISLKGKRFEVTGFTIDPGDTQLAKKDVQFDLIAGNMGTIHATGMDVDEILNEGMVNLDSVRLENIDINITRDKRLPDPPFIEKPFLLSSIVPKVVKFKNAVVRNGRIQYNEISKKTGGEGNVQLNDIQATLKYAKSTNGNPFRSLSLEGSLKLYDQGSAVIHYKDINEDTFHIIVDVHGIDFTTLNQMVDPVQLVEIRSGKLDHLYIDAVANREFAKTDATMSYSDLHLKFHKQDGTSGLGKDMLTLLVDGVVLKHSKYEATGSIEQPRIHDKSVFNYWVKILMHGALKVVRHGKSVKQHKRKN